MEIVRDILLMNQLIWRIQDEGSITFKVSDQILLWQEKRFGKDKILKGEKKMENKEIEIYGHIFIHGYPCCPYCGKGLKKHWEIQGYTDYVWYTCDCNPSQKLLEIKELDTKIKHLTKQRDELQQELDKRKEVVNAYAIITKNENMKDLYL